MKDPVKQTIEYKRRQKERWTESNKEKVFNYNRKHALQQCMNRKSLPCASTIQKYGISRHEIDAILDHIYNIEDRP